MLLCLCGSQKTYALCCKSYIDMQQTPETPEQLMRSRYSAYSQAKIEYIQKTMKGKASMAFNAAEARDWSQKITWIELQVIQSYLETPDKGFVEFIAHYMEQNQIKSMHELSEFHKENNAWFYVDGVHKESPLKNKQKIGRNSPCPCGSGKKFKICHEK